MLPMLSKARQSLIDKYLWGSYCILLCSAAMGEANLIPDSRKLRALLRERVDRRVLQSNTGYRSRDGGVGARIFQAKGDVQA